MQLWLQETGCKVTVGNKRNHLRHGRARVRTSHRSLAERRHRRQNAKTNELQWRQADVEISRSLSSLWDFFKKKLKLDFFLHLKNKIISSFILLP